MADEYLEHLVRTGTLGGLGTDVDKEQSAAAHRMRLRLVRARRYIVEDEAATAASRLATSNPEILGQLLPGARSPYPSLWLEWTHNAQLDGTGFRYTFDGSRPADRVAALIEQDPLRKSLFRISLFLRQYEPTYSQANREGFVLSEIPIGFVVDTDCQLSDNIRSDQNLMAKGFSITGAAMASGLLGTAQIGTIVSMQPGDPEFHDPERGDPSQFRHDFRVGPDGRVILSDTAKAQFDITDEELEARALVCERIAKYGCFTLAEQHRLLWQAILQRGLREEGKSYFRTIHQVVEMRSGLWGYLVALLAMMSNPDLVEGSSEQRSGKSRLVRGKPLPFLKHHILKLRLTRRATVDQTIRTMVGRLSPRRHEVAGHWKTTRRRGDPNCNHAWVPLTSSRQSCGLCEGLRWWVTSFERGDATRGAVIKDRLVTRE